MSASANVGRVAFEPSDIVEAGYDRIAVRHLAWVNEIQGDPRLRFLDDLMARLPAKPAVLDLGCGAGVPCTAKLAERGEVVGVELSGGQLELARRNVPNARFIKVEMTAVELPLASFDAVTAFYSICHVPRAMHGPLFKRVASWLRPGGHFLASLGYGADGGTIEGWLGVPMFFSGNGPETNRRLLAEAGLTVIVDEAVTMNEPEGPATFQWLIARRAA